jgi:hypothetical protein
MKITTVAAVETVETERTNAVVVACKAGTMSSENFAALAEDPNMLVLVVKVSDDLVITPKRGKGEGTITWLVKSIKSRLSTGTKTKTGEEQYLAANGKALEFRVEVNLVD